MVDDEAHVRKALERLLRGAGLEVETYASGEEYLAAFERSRPDCVVLDAHMPGATGFEVQQRMRACGSRIAVVMISGHDGAGAEGLALSNGAHAYLRKPVDGVVLVNAIEGAIQASRR